MDIRIHWPERKSTSGQVPNFTISCNDMSMTVDIDRLPNPLHRLLPSKALTKATPQEWKPFCVSAIAHGYMR